MKAALAMVKKRAVRKPKAPVSLILLLAFALLINYLDRSSILGIRGLATCGRMVGGPDRRQKDPDRWVLYLGDRHDPDGDCGVSKSAHSAWRYLSQIVRRI